MQVTSSAVHGAPEPFVQDHDTEIVLVLLLPDTTPSLVHAGKSRLGSQLDETSKVADEPPWIVVADPPLKIATIGATNTVRLTEYEPGTEMLLPPVRVPVAKTDKPNV